MQKARAGRLLAWGWTALVAALAAVAGLTWFADWRLLDVSSPSMSPTVARHSLAVVSPVAPRSVEAGDVIQFRDPSGGGATVLHRVERVVPTSDGGRAFATRGDANRTADPALVPQDALLGRLRFSVPRVGAVASALAPPVGTVVLTALPLVLLAAAELRRPKRRATAPEHPDAVALV